VRGGQAVIINHGNKICHIHTLEAERDDRVTKDIGSALPHLWTQSSRVFHAHEHYSQNSGKAV